MVKKSLTLILCVTMICLLAGCEEKMTDPHIPGDYMSSKEYRDKEGFQDYTDFCIYRYDSAHSFESMGDYNRIQQPDEIEKLAGYFTNFQKWMELEKRLDEYSFEESCISAGDYYFIKTKEGQPIGDGKYGPYDNYSVYFFDTETLSLYYIHNNI